MTSIKIKALLLLLLHLHECTILVVKQDKSEKEERQLADPGSLVIAGVLIGSLFLYLFTKTKIIHWQDDKQWEQRFLEITENETFTLSFMNLLIDSYSMELSNACIRHFQQSYENKIDSIPHKMSRLAMTEYKNEHWMSLVDNQKYCISFFRFVLSHGFITKYMLNSSFAMFYYRLAFENNHKGSAEGLKNFLNELDKVIKSDSVFKSIDTTHRNYFYITVNYFLDSNNELKKLK